MKFAVDVRTLDTVEALFAVVIAAAAAAVEALSSGFTGCCRCERADWPCCGSFLCLQGREELSTRGKRTLQEQFSSLCGSGLVYACVY